MTSIFWLLCCFLFCLSCVSSRKDSIKTSSSDNGPSHFKHARRIKLGKAKRDCSEDPNNNKNGRKYNNLNPEETRTRTYLHEVDQVSGDEYEIHFDFGPIETMENNRNGKTNGNTNGENEGDNDELRRRLHVLGSDGRSRNGYCPALGVVASHTGRLVNNNGGWCTATLIDYDWVITAAHCLHSGPGGSWYSYYYWYPKENGCRVAGYASSYQVAFNGWLNNGDIGYDIGWVKLANSPNLGYHCIGWNSGITTSHFFYMYGYPQDKPTGTLWLTYDYLDIVSTHLLETDETDDAGGSSGGPAFNYGINPFWCIYGIHHGYWIGGNHIEARITQSKFNAICGYISGC